MSCCPRNTCLEVYLVPGATEIRLPFSADETGTWKTVVEFNGVVIRTDIDVVAGQPIMLPNDLNENYRHTLKIFREDGSLFNDTCYLIKTIYTIFTDCDCHGSTTPPPTPSNNTLTLTIPFLLS